MPRRPEVPRVGKPSSFACRAERLARTGTGPNRSIVGPSSEAKCVAPDSNAGEEMALSESVKIARAHVFDASLVNNPGRNVSSVDEVSEPLSCIWVDLVVIGAGLHRACTLAFVHVTQLPPLMYRRVPRHFGHGVPCSQAELFFSS